MGKHSSMDHVPNQTEELLTKEQDAVENHDRSSDGALSCQEARAYNRKIYWRP